MSDGKARLETTSAQRSTEIMGDLGGRIALVTGGAQGIGRAIAEELAAAGATLALADVNETKLAETVGELKAQGIDATAFTMNVSSEESIEAGAKAILEKFGKVEILVNNAGITRDNLMLRMKRADWDLVLSINLTGAFLLTQALLSPMLKNRWGRIVSIASVVGRAGQAGQVNYAASKAGLIGFTRSLAREVASRGIYSRIVSDLREDWGQTRNCTGCGKCVQACPTGALAEKGFSVHEMVKQSDGVTRLALQRAHQAGSPSR
jgi:3-oxoacyl-[acyl-carrier protein] reductase